jgi:hypothetical protein
MPLRQFLPELGRSARSRSFMDLVDIVVWDWCHDISGIIAVQHEQLNFAHWARAMALPLLLLMGSGAWAGAATGQITGAITPDPLLDSGPTDPCAAGVDYADAVDANGKAVVPADVEARPVPLPDSIAVPLGNNPARNPNRNLGRNGNRYPGRQANPVTLGGDSTYIAIDGRKLEPLVNPAPCASVH